MTVAAQNAVTEPRQWRGLAQREYLLRKAAIISAIFCSVAFLLAQNPTTSKKAPAKSTAKKTASQKKSPSKKTPAKSARSWRSTQRTPTPERYRDIQQALATKGYLHTS